VRVLVLFLCRWRGRSSRAIAECCRVLKWTCQWVASVDRLEGRDVPDCELQVELRAPHAFAHVVFDVLKFWKRGCIRCTVWCGAHDRFKGVVGNPLEEIRVNSSRRYKVMNSVHCLRPFVVHVLQCSIARTAAITRSSLWARLVVASRRRQCGRGQRLSVGRLSPSLLT
jgi:hypothetical protein